MLSLEPLSHRAEGKGESVHRLQSHTVVSRALLSSSQPSQAQAPSCHLANPSKTTPASAPRLLPLLLKLPEPGNLLVSFLFSRGHLPLVLGCKLGPGLLSFPAI